MGIYYNIYKSDCAECVFLKQQQAFVLIFLYSPYFSHLGDMTKNVQDNCVSYYKKIYRRNGNGFIPGETVMMDPSSVLMMCSQLKNGEITFALYTAL